MNTTLVNFKQKPKVIHKLRDKNTHANTKTNIIQHKHLHAKNKQWHLQNNNNNNHSKTLLYLYLQIKTKADKKMIKEKTSCNIPIIHKHANIHTQSQQQKHT